MDVRKDRKKCVIKYQKVATNYIQLVKKYRTLTFRFFRRFYLKDLPEGNFHVGFLG